MEFKTSSTPEGCQEGVQSWVLHSIASVLTLSWTHVPVLRRYIANQEGHHRKTSFVDELKRLLDKNGVRYDPKYLL